MPEVIFDATVLSNFAAAGRSSLLEERYREVGFTTIEISDELRRGVEAGYEYLTSALKQIETVSPRGSLRVLTPSSAEEHRLRTTWRRAGRQKARVSP